MISDDLRNHRSRETIGSLHIPTQIQLMFSGRYNSVLNVALVFYILAAVLASFSIIFGLAAWYKMKLARIVLPLTAVSLLVLRVTQTIHSPTSLETK